MSLELQVITDLAVLMVVASLVAALFHKLKQPIILGYLIAGIIIGPYTPPFSLVSNIDFLNVFAEIGVILLLFTIGFEFPISKLRSIGRVVIGVSVIEIAFMLSISWLMGTYLFHWSFNDTLFLGAALASSSTTIIAKVLGDMGKIKEISSVIMLGILVVEDVVVVVLLAMLQNLAVASTISVVSTLTLIVKLVFFVGGTLGIGYFIIPRLIDRIADLGNRELLYILMIGLCFGFSILATQIGFSVAIGAFLIGVVAAKSKARETIKREIDPFQQVFGAIFFVSIGALMDFSQFSIYWIPAVIITLAVLGIKLATCGLGTRIFGYDRTTSLRVGLGMAQIGEFAFIVVKAGQDLGVLSDFLLPIIGIATIITSFTTPYLIRLSFNRKNSALLPVQNLAC